MARSLKRIGMGLFLVLALLTPFLYTRAGGDTRVYAAASNDLNFQARLLSSAGSIVPDGTYSVEFNLYSVVGGGTAQWTETQATLQVKSGYLSAHLGSTTPFPSTIDWGQEQWLTMNVNGDGEMSPRLKLTAIPLAFRANQADSLTNGSSTLEADDLAQLSPASAQVINSALAALRLNQTGAGGLLQLQNGGSDVFAVAGTGTVNSSGSATFLGGTLNLGAATQSGGLVISDGSSNTGTINTLGLTSNRVYSLPDADGTICLTTTCSTATDVFVNDGNSFGGLATIGTDDAFDVVLEAAGTERIRINQSTGNVKIGSGTADEKLDVDGAINLGTTSNSNAGSIRWTGTDFEGYNGSIWQSLTDTGGLVVNPAANKRKAADETQNIGNNATATLQDDDELFFAIGANETWSFSFVVQSNNPAAPDIKFAVTAPGGATCRYGQIDAEGTTTTSNLACGASTGTIVSTAGDDIFIVTGTVVNGVTAGNVTLQWAQGVANAANTIVRAGSYLTASRISGPGQTAEAFIQDGNTFSAQAVFGTNDANSLALETNGVTRAVLDTSGGLTFQQTTTISAANAAAAGYGLTLQAGTATSGTANGGGLALIAGNGSGVSSGGTVSLTAGNAAFIGGDVTILAGNGTSGGAGIAGNISLNAGTGLAGASKGTISIGVTNASTITLGNAGDNTDLNLNSGTGTISIGTGAQARTVNIGTGAAAQTLNIGSLSSTGITTIQAGGNVVVDSSAGSIELQDSTNINGNLDTSGSIFAGNGNAFQVNADGDITSVFTALNGTSTSNGVGASSTSLTLTDATNFDIGNYVQMNSANCGGTGVNPCYAKIVDKVGNVLTISPALTWANGSTVNEYHVPELGGTNTGSALNNRYGRGYFIAGIAVGNGTTFYNEDSIETSLTTFNLLDSGVTTLNIGGAATSVSIGNSSSVVNILGSLETSATETITAGGGLVVSTGGANISGGLDNNSGGITDAGSIGGVAGLTFISGALDLANGGIINAGSIAGATTINATGAISAATATNTINGLVINGGALSAITGITFTSGNLNLSNGGITNTGSIAGATTLALSGAISGATVTDTINGLVINSGALSSITTINASGAITAATATNTINGLIISSGAVSGATTINASGLITSVGFTGGSGLIQNTGGITSTGAITFNANASTNTTSIGSGTTSGQITIGGGSAPLVIDSTNFDVSSGGGLSGITGFAQSSGNFTMSGTGTFSTSSGLVSLNGATTIATSVNSTSALTINGTSGTAAAALRVTQTGNAENVVMTNTARTTGALVSLTQSTSAFTGTGLLLNFASGSGSFASGNFADFQLNGTSRFSVDNSGALAINSDSNSALRITSTAGVQYFDVDVGGNQITIGNSDTTGVQFVLDTKTDAGDPVTGVNGGMYYNSSANKFRCFENSTWKNCITPEADTGIFEDITAAAFAGDNQTTQIFNDATKPNIVTKSTTSTVLINIHISGISNTNNDAFFAARVVFTTNGVDPTCASTQVGRSMISGFTTATTHPYQMAGSFVHSPGVAGTIKYTVCSSDDAMGTTLTDTPDNVTVSLVELGA